MSGKKYPFYGVQWHPEVNRFQWNSKMKFPHSPHAVQLSSLLAEFFVNEGKELNTVCFKINYRNKEGSKESCFSQSWLGFWVFKTANILKEIMN